MHNTNFLYLCVAHHALPKVDYQLSYCIPCVCRENQFTNCLFRTWGELIGWKFPSCVDAFEVMSYPHTVSFKVCKILLFYFCFLVVGCVNVCLHACCMVARALSHCTLLKPFSACYEIKVCLYQLTALEREHWTQ